MYLRWQRALPNWVRIVPVELPGRGTRMSEAFDGDYAGLIEQLCNQHGQHCDGRYALYGHSMGGLIAHGMAVRWRALSRRLPEVLFASASPAPRHRDPDYFVGKESDADLIAELRKQGGTAEQVFEDPEMLGITLETLRADYRLCAGYRYVDTKPLAVPIHAFAGRKDLIEPERIAAWEQESSIGFSLRWFDGGHFFIREYESAVLSAVVRHLTSEVPRVVHAPAVVV